MLAFIRVACCVGACLLAATGVGAAQEVQVDPGPGGNIVVQAVDGRTVYVAPDQRDIQKGQWWFYWSLRLRASADAPVKFVFSNQNPLGMRGPATSRDGGMTWQWLGAERVQSFRHEGRSAWSFEVRVPEDRGELLVAYCPHYRECHLRAWLDRQSPHAPLRVEELCRSRQGRSVELLRAGCLDRERSRGVILLTSRHHACEAMATYALEGFLSAVLADDELGRRWQENWEVIAVPFMDKDGVENGDSGKNRAPHDHNRDYNDQPLYPEVAAWMKLGGTLQDRVVATMDMHCPWIRGQWNDLAYFVGPRNEEFWKKMQRYAATLARVRTGPIPFQEQDCLAFGMAWNTGGNFAQGRSCSAWSIDTFPHAALVASLELPYADSRGVEVTADSARAFGRDLAQALAEHLDQR